MGESTIFHRDPEGAESFQLITQGDLDIQRFLVILICLAPCPL